MKLVLQVNKRCYHSYSQIIYPRESSGSTEGGVEWYTVHPGVLEVFFWMFGVLDNLWKTPPTPLDEQCTTHSRPAQGATTALPRGK